MYGANGSLFRDASLIMGRVWDLKSLNMHHFLIKSLKIPSLLLQSLNMTQVAILVGNLYAKTAFKSGSHFTETPNNGCIFWLNDL